MWTALLGQPYALTFAQSFAFVEKERAKALFAQQRRRLISAGDEAISQVAALEAAMDGLLSNDFTVGEHNAALLVHADDRRTLGGLLGQAQAALSDPGCVVVREDLAMEGQVLAALPGNFAFRPRVAPVTSRNFAAFSPFYCFPSGRPDGHHWGRAVTLLRTRVATPLWFSPHVGDLGHTTIIGMSGSGKTALIAFLLCAFADVDVRHLILDKDQGLRLIVRALGGDYRALTRGEPTGFNPFALPLTPVHAQYLHDLVRLLAGEPWAARHSKQVDNAIASLYTLEPMNRRLASLVHFLDLTEEGGIAERLRPWVGDGRFAWVFDAVEDTLAFGRLTAFDVTAFLDDPLLRTPITSYLLYRSTPLIDGSPFALWIDEFWRLLDDPYFEQFVRDQLKTIRKKNGIVVTSTQSPSDALRSGIASAILEQTPTKLFLPNEYADARDYRDGFKLTQAEWALLRPLTKSARQLLIKQTGLSTLVDFDLGEIADTLPILSGTEATIRRLEALQRAGGGELPPDWIDRIAPPRG
jgi:type IV secretion system protein VirB4